MKETIEGLKKALYVWRNKHRELSSAIRLRDGYLLNPVSGVDEISKLDSAPEGIKKYSDIFKTPVNVNLAKEDCLTEINNWVLALSKEVDDCESAAYELLNKVISVNADSAGTLEEHYNAAVIGDQLIAAGKDLPKIELFNRQATRRATAHMARLDARASEVENFLYGVNYALSDSDLESLTDKVAYPKLENFLSLDSEIDDVRYSSSMAGLDARIGVVESIRPVKYCSRKPDTALSCLDLVYALSKEVSVHRDEMLNGQYDYEFTPAEHGAVTAVLTEELSDPTSLLEKSVAAHNAAERNIRALAVVANEVAVFEVDIYAEIMLLKAAMDVVTATVLGDAG